MLVLLTGRGKEGWRRRAISPEIMEMRITTPRPKLAEKARLTS